MKLSFHILSAAFALVLLAGCSSASPPTTATPSSSRSSSPSVAPSASTAATPRPTVVPQAIGTVTIRLEGCSLEATSEPIHAGPVALRVVNASGVDAAADLWNIRSDAPATSYDAFAADTAAKHEAALRGDNTGSHPWYLRAIATNTLVPAGQERTVIGLAPPGTAGIACLRYHAESKEIRPLQAVGPIEILPAG